MAEGDRPLCAFAPRKPDALASWVAFDVGMLFAGVVCKDRWKTPVRSLQLNEFFAPVADVSVQCHAVRGACVSWLSASVTLVDQDRLYPLEFFIAATPMSLQASGRSKERWKASVAEAARRRIRETDELGFLDRRPLALTVHYFPAATMIGDIDNILKPILDALSHVAYMDDRDVERIVVQKFEPEVAWDFAEPSDQLAAALDAGAPVVYVRVDDDLSWRTIE